MYSKQILSYNFGTERPKLTQNLIEWRRRYRKKVATDINFKKLQSEYVIMELVQKYEDKVANHRSRICIHMLKQPIRNFYIFHYLVLLDTFMSCHNFFLFSTTHRKLPIYYTTCSFIAQDIYSYFGRQRWLSIQENFGRTRLGCIGTILLSQLSAIRQSRNPSEVLMNRFRLPKTILDNSSKSFMQ